MRQNFFTFAITLLTMLFSTTAFATSIAYPADGIYSIQPQCAPDKELSVQNHASNWGANVIIDNINPNWRKWKIQRIGNTDFYSIIAVHSNLALDVANAQALNGVNIATWPFLEGKQNQFRFLDTGGGYYMIQVNIAGGFVVDVANGENRAGVNVQSWGFNNSPAQLWRLVPVQRLSTFQTFNKKATKKVTAYVMPDLQAKSGNEYVSAGDDVTVLREEGNAYLVRYPVNGGTKTRWVNKNEIFSGGNPTQTPVHTPSGDVKQRLLNTIFGRNGGRISCDFDSYVNTPGHHEGIDMVLHDGAEIHAITSGIVTKAGGDSLTTVAIYDSANNKTVVYLHMSSVVGLYINKHVNKGDVIGYQGSKGASSSHIHLEVRDGKRSAAAKSVNDPTLDNSNPYVYLERAL